MERTRLRELTHGCHIDYPLHVLFVEMERTRLRELTHCQCSRMTVRDRSRNGAYPIKGIDTNCHHHHFRYHFLVEMERTRLRELTPISAFVTSPSTIEVEMERTRLRELTRYNISFFFPTNMVEMERTRLRELTHF